MKIALDTNVLIYFLEGIEPQASKVEKILNLFMKAQDEGIISTIAVAEVLTGFYMAREEKKVAEAKKLLNDLTLNSFKIVPVTFEIADLAANLRAKRGGRLPDALIVATALNQAANIVYSQDKDLQRFNKDIKICELS
ncbi:MAG: PIN domain-containing protein [Candidatus Bathyarchaeia archaeon]|jgi:predicted nucleic acid-binding protein